MNKVTIFKYEENKPVRIMNINGEPWFVLKDVCEVLGMDSTQLKKVADRLEEDEKGRTQITTPGGAQESWIISESGLYNVILRSDKPEAKPFRKSRPWCCPASAIMAATLPGRRSFPRRSLWQRPCWSRRRP